MLRKLLKCCLRWKRKNGRCPPPRGKSKTGNISCGSALDTIIVVNTASSGTSLAPAVVANTFACSSTNVSTETPRKVPFSGVKSPKWRFKRSKSNDFGRGSKRSKMLKRPVQNDTQKGETSSMDIADRDIYGAVSSSHKTLVKSLEVTREKSKDPFRLQRDDTHRAILDEVAEFYQRFAYPQTDIRVLISKNVIVYVLGTNHANAQCRDDVVDVIKKIRPQSVLVELCPLRACGCAKHCGNAFQSTPQFNFRYLRNTINQLGFLPAMIFFTDVFREHMVSESSLLHYGGEFIAAMTTAQSQPNCRLVLADRPIEITVKRQASAMGNWRGLKVTLQVTMALMMKKHMKKLMMNANKLVFDDPKTYEVLVFERDLYLTHAIQKAAQSFDDHEDVRRIVAVIGQGHMQGIQTYWGKVPNEFIPFIMSPYTVLDK